MAQAPETPTLVVIVFDPSKGQVSVNGGPWVPFKLGARADRVGKKDVPKPPDFPPPGEGDDTMECFRCVDHGICHLHVWTGARWLDLASPCTGPFCP